MDELWRLAPTPALRFAKATGSPPVEANAAARAWEQSSGIGLQTLATQALRQAPEGGQCFQAELRLSDDSPGFAGLVTSADGAWLLWLVGLPPVATEPQGTMSRRMELAADSLGVGFWSRDVNEDRVEWDTRMYQLYGRSPAAGAPNLEAWLNQHVHPDDAPRLRRRAAARWDETSLAVRDTFRILLPDGRERWIQGWTRRRRGERGYVDFGLHMDVTERRLAELHLERERDRDRFAIESAGIGVWERGFDGRPSFWSPTMYRLRGLSPADPRPLQELVQLTVSARDLAEADQRMVRCVQMGETYRHEFKVHWPDGTERWLSSIGRAVRDAGGQVLALAGVNVDITERHLASELTRERDRAEQASAAKSSLMARVSHELRTPMNAVLGFADLMAQDPQAPLPAAQRDRLAQIRSAASHLMGLIDDLLELSRAEAGSQTLRLETVPLDALLQEAEQWVAALAEQHGVAVQPFRLPPGPPPAVLADKRRLGQVVVNLLTNGIKYNRPGGQVQVSVEPALVQGHRAWELCVSDDGRGLSPEQVARLFEPFNRLGAEREGIPGTGIGLSIVQQLVQEMGGQLAVDSRPGQGSRFCVRLVTAESDAAGEAGPTAPDRAAPGPVVPPGGAADHGPTSPHRRLRVVYVEDNPVNELLVREMLSLRPGVELKSAPDGHSGMALALAERPDVVLLDLQLPDLSGIEVLRRLRREPLLAGSSFVALSANAMPDDVRHALAQGFDDYWTKPLDLPRFLAAVDALALKHQGASRSRTQLPESSSR